MSITRSSVVVVLVRGFFILDPATTVRLVFQAAHEKVLFTLASFIGPINLQNAKLVNVHFSFHLWGMNMLETFGVR